MSALPHTPFIAAQTPSESRAIILAGGGMRVAYQAGVLKALHEEGLRFSHADGSSGGTINLAALLSGITPNELCERWRTLNVHDFVSLLPLPDYLRGDLPALGSAHGLEYKVYPALGIDIDKVNAATGIDASFNVCRFDTKVVVPLSQQELDLPRLVAAASLPMFMPAVQSHGATWTDAVWIKDANLLATVQRGARELWVIWCIGDTPQFKHGTFNQYVHMIEMSAIGALNEELEAIAGLNLRIANGETVEGHDSPIVVHLIKPQFPLPLDPAFYLGHIDAATLIDLGYSDARHYLRNRQPQGIALSPGATKTLTPGLGIRFREMMSGGFLLGANDALEGARRGAQTPLSMHASIYIPDIAAFIADPQHRAPLAGHIDFAPFGCAIPAESGTFQLFAPTKDADTTWMVYDLGFRHEGKSYYLAGHKIVRIGAPWKLWPDTTTLYTTLHEGTDAMGPIIGAGVLRLGVGELMKLMRTLHASDADAPGDAGRAVSRFFGFFSRELLRTYVLRRPLAASP
jgi:predicted patatin/cPLA2 family phospholipase